MAKQVTIKTASVGTNFATCAIIRDAKNRRKLAETREFPYGFTGPAIEAAEAIAAQRGWTVVNNRA
jgi:hypothetical protein